MIRVIYIGLLSLIIIMAAILFVKKDKTDLNPLGDIHEEIVTDYPDMSHISRATFETQLQSNEFLILDTRPVEEYNISHIKGALQVDPDISPKAFKTKFETALKNKKLVVYCSVGRRSSILGERIRNTALSAGAISIQNLEGGLFGWHNDNRPLVNNSGATSEIHPYNSFWGRLIENKEFIRHHP